MVDSHLTLVPLLRFKLLDLRVNIMEIVRSLMSKRRIDSHRMLIITPYRALTDGKETLGGLESVQYIYDSLQSLEDSMTSSMVSYASGLILCQALPWLLWRECLLTSSDSAR